MVKIGLVEKLPTIPEQGEKTWEEYLSFLPLFRPISMDPGVSAMIHQHQLTCTRRAP